MSLVAALHGVVRKLVADPLCVVYVRGKPGEGLVTGYQPALGRRAGVTWPLVSASLSDDVLSTPGLEAAVRSLDRAELEGDWPGVLRSPRLGLTIRWFPADPALPGLAGALFPVPGSRLFAALSEACRSRVVRIVAVPVEYKPGLRCVIRYDVATTRTPLVVFGKVHPDVAQAAATYRLTARLWQPGPSAAPLVPRPLDLLPELPLTLAEAARGVGGTRVLRPSTPPDRLDEAVAAAARALSWLHARDVPAGLEARPLGSRFAARAAGWLADLERHAPGEAPDLASACRDLLCALPDLRADPLRVVHGEFRASQLIFCRPGRVVITDLDTACLGDPAFDVGCLMAFLRPPALWRGSADACAWFRAAREKFLDAYGADDALRRRAALYEAVFVLKNVSRRTRNVNSPRPRELRLAAREIHACLGAAEPVRAPALA